MKNRGSSIINADMICRAVEASARRLCCLTDSSHARICYVLQDSNVVEVQVEAGTPKPLLASNEVGAAILLKLISQMQGKVMDHRSEVEMIQGNGKVRFDIRPGLRVSRLHVEIVR